jgi:hypothetical protein
MNKDRPLFDIIFRILDILDDREKEGVVGRFGLDTGGGERTHRVYKASGEITSYKVVLITIECIGSDLSADELLFCFSRCSYSSIY